MTEKEQTDRFCHDLDNLVERYRNEYEMTYASVVGALHMKAWLMCQESTEQEHAEDDHP